jgi:hypothetical protein
MNISSSEGYEESCEILYSDHKHTYYSFMERYLYGNSDGGDGVVGFHR